MSAGGCTRRGRHSGGGVRNIMASAREEPTIGPSVDPPDEELDPTQPHWVGYFRLPKNDVRVTRQLPPNYR